MMKERNNQILIGGILGIAYLIGTVFIVFAISGFANNMGMLAVLPFNAQTAFLVELFARVLEKIGIGYIRNTSMAIVASFLSGAVAGWLLSYWKRCPLIIFVILTLLSQLIISLVAWFMYLGIHGPLQVS